MSIYIDGLMGFYIVGAIVVLVLTMFAFIASWNERGIPRRSHKTTTTTS